MLSGQGCVEKQQTTSNVSQAAAAHTCLHDWAQTAHAGTATHTRQTNPYTTRHGQSAGQHQHTLRCSWETAVPAASLTVPMALFQQLHTMPAGWRGRRRHSYLSCGSATTHNRAGPATDWKQLQLPVACLHKTFAPHTSWLAKPLPPGVSDAACLADNAMLLHSVAPAACTSHTASGAAGSPYNWVVDADWCWWGDPAACG
jgi:hypothetical protein